MESKRYGLKEVDQLIDECQGHFATGPRYLYVNAVELANILVDFKEKYLFLPANGDKFVYREFEIRQLNTSPKGRMLASTQLIQDELPDKFWMNEARNMSQREYEREVLNFPKPVHGWIEQPIEIPRKRDN